MKEKPTKQRQKTPEGFEIPIPKRTDVFRDLKKTAKPRKRLRLRRSQKKG